ncbi:hypothetical protein HMPREF1548_01755 [Clostridium sp. KLE 1755]|nr:hypothetical protein HMPREF1548_01755 [Clostridium sp. KLE 1755]
MLDEFPAFLFISLNQTATLPALFTARRMAIHFSTTFSVQICKPFRTRIVPA